MSSPRKKLEEDSPGDCQEAAVNPTLPLSLFSWIVLFRFSVTPFVLYYLFIYFMYCSVVLFV